MSAQARSLPTLLLLLVFQLACAPRAGYQTRIISFALLDAITILTLTKEFVIHPVL